MPIILDTTEKRDGLSIYWFVDSKTEKRVYGVCFENGFFNIHNQGIAESMSLANEILTTKVETL